MQNTIFFTFLHFSHQLSTLSGHQFSYLQSFSAVLHFLYSLRMRIFYHCLRMEMDFFSVHVECVFSSLSVCNYDGTLLVSLYHSFRSFRWNFYWKWFCDFFVFLFFFCLWNFLIFLNFMIFFNDFRFQLSLLNNW